MYYMNQDAVDYFQVDFTSDESIIGGKHYPLGTFAVEMMECGWSGIMEIRQPVKRFQEEFQVFLAARDPSSAATALCALRKLWQAFGKLPVYNKLLVGDYRMNALLPYLRKHPDIVDEMLTPGTPRNEGYTRWMGKLEHLEDELQAFVKNTQWMLDEFFQNLPSRKRQDYIRAYARYRDAMEDAIQESEIFSMAEFGDFTEDSPNKKGISKLQIRMELDAGSCVELFLQFDSSGEWTPVTVLKTTRKRSFYLPIVPRRCDHFRIRLKGAGDWKLYSITRETYSGSELKSTKGRQ